MNASPETDRPDASQQVLYRKWRPRLFADVSGQEPITTTLRNAVAAGAPAHAYLFTGPRGTGKTTSGRIMAKAVNCLSPVNGEPDESCSSCELFNAGRALDLIELDAASNRGIDEMRDLREGAGFAPNNARYKVYLIDEVHMLTDAAFNALLKTLEEPPPHVIFILATTEAHRLPATITSRCQRFDFRRIPLDAVIGRLAEIASGEEITVAEGGLDLIARHATGSLRDAINLLDQLVAYHGRTLDLDAVRSGLGLVVDDRTTELARAAVTRDLGAGLSVIAAAQDDGLEIRAFIRQVVSTLRSALMVKAGAADQLGLSDGETADLSALAADTTVGDIVAALRALGQINFAGDAYDSLPAEIAFASLATAAVEAPPAAAAPAAPVAAAPAAAAPAAAAPQPPAEAPRPAAREPQRQPTQPQRPRAEQSRPTTPARETEAQEPAAREPAATPSATPRPASNAAPAKEPAAPAFVPPDDGEVSEQLLAARAQWDAIRDGTRKRLMKAGALLSESYIKACEEDSIEIGFRYPSHVDMVKTDQAVLTAIEESCAAALGRTLAVSAVLWEGLQRSGPAPARSSSGGHLVEEALKQGAVLADDA